MQHKASPVFSIFTPGDLHTINLEGFPPSASVFIFFMRTKPRTVSITADIDIILVTITYFNPLWYRAGESGFAFFPICTRTGYPHNLSGSRSGSDLVILFQTGDKVGM
jgi:hypothetical protein